MKLAHVVIALLFSPGLLAITCCPKTTSQSQVVNLTAKDSLKTLALVKGREFTLTLPDHTDGGYHFDKPQFDTTILRLEKQSEKPPAPNSALGAPGQVMWQFIAMKTGTTALKITASRPWTKAGVITEFENTVTVK
ncbi:MAG: protease inhibitor I42 family protein [Sphingobacteriales bacterium]